MRVLVTPSDIHCWLAAGHFTIHADGRVTWRTPHDPMRDFARVVDDDVVVPPGAEGLLPLTAEGVSDVLLLDDTRAAIAYAGPAPRVEVVQRATGAVLETVALTGTGPRVPTLHDDEAWREDEVDFDGGFGTRGIRLFHAAGGFLVTARDSGHLARYVAETKRLEILRLPGVPENTYYALDGRAGGTIVGIKWNGRHAQLIALDAGGAVQGVWPADPDEVAWGMPAPVRVGDHVLAYSDDGPHAGELALLDGTSLAPLDHAPVPSWPVDAHAHGDRFAAVSGQHVVVGTASNDRLRIEVFTVEELMRRARVEPPARPPHATREGRGTRRWLEHEIQWLGFDGDVPLVARAGDGAVLAVEPEGTRVVLRGGPRPKALFDAPTVARPLHAQRGRLLSVLDTVLRVVDLATGATVATLDIAGVQKAWLIEEGVFHVSEVPKSTASPDEMASVFPEQEIVHGYTPFGGAARELSRASTTFAPRELVAIDGPTVWWCQVNDAGATALCRYTVGALRCEVEMELAEPAAIAVRDGVPFVLAQDPDEARQALYRRDGTALTQLAGAGLPYFLSQLAVTATAAYTTEPITHGRDGIAPSRLFRIDLASGAVEVLSTSIVGELRGLHVAGGELRWYESGAGETAICRLPLEA